jgi:hypothetical protein
VTFDRPAATGGSRHSQGDPLFNGHGFTSVADLGSNPLETAVVRRRI